MPRRRNQLVFCDTNVLIEAFRVSGWEALAGAYQLATVDMCCHEAGRGPADRPGYVTVDVAAVRQSAQVFQVSEMEKADLMLRLMEAAALDPGELELLAHLRTRRNIWWVCSPDAACLRAAYSLQLLDRFVALEELFDEIGFRAQLKRNYTKKWMVNFRTRLRLEKLS